MLYLGNNLDVLKTFSDSSIDSIVTDPPYGLSFMGKKWDYDVPSVDLWRECLRVLKPGGHLLAFGGTRTYHRLVVAIEDAGFEIRDQIQWIYGSGFPKSLNVSKAIDKEAGVEREVVGKIKQPRSNVNATSALGGSFQESPDITIPATSLAKQWDGWGTALKPANEPICLARKPISEKTVAQNVVKWGTGAINVDACRIGFSATDPNIRTSPTVNSGEKSMFNLGNGPDGKGPEPQGRWPANVLFDEEAAEVLDEQSIAGGIHSAGKGASRFFYVAKASARERGEGNGHPTVKPIKLMEYLVTLITPPGGIVLDPFMGSGTTGIACKNKGLEFEGIELQQEYFEIAKNRIGKDIKRELNAKE